MRSACWTAAADAALFYGCATAMRCRSGSARRCPSASGSTCCAAGWPSRGSCRRRRPRGLIEGLRQALTAEADHVPAVVWGEHALRRYRERLFLTPAAAARARRAPGMADALADRGSSSAAGLGTLALGPRDGRAGCEPAAGRPERPAPQRRRDAEARRRDARTQSVQHLCQAMGVLPWMRDALPMIYAGESLIAVGDLWRDARWAMAARQMGPELRLGGGAGVVLSGAREAWAGWRKSGGVDCRRRA